MQVQICPCRGSLDIEYIGTGTKVYIQCFHGIIVDAVNPRIELQGADKIGGVNMIDSEAAMLTAEGDMVDIIVFSDRHIVGKR